MYSFPPTLQRRLSVRLLEGKVHHVLQGISDPQLSVISQYYPELREELIEFVLDFLSLEGVASRTKLSEEGAGRTEAAFERATDKVLKQVGSFKELRIVADESLMTLAQTIHLPLSVLDGLERGMIELESVPAKLFERLGRSLGRVPAEIRSLLQNQGRQLRAVHWRAEAAPKASKRKTVSFEEALRKSEDFDEEYRKDWLPEAG